MAIKYPYKNIMIQYKYFKYLFFRYFAYNILYSVLFIWIPVLFYIIIIFHLLNKIEELDQIKEMIKYGLNNFDFYKIPFNYLDNITKSLIILFCILFITGYFCMTKVILNCIFSYEYKNIIIVTKIKKISWLNTTLFSICNSTPNIIGIIGVVYFQKILSYYPNMYYISILLHIINFGISWLITYYLLNRFIEYFAKIKIKPLPRVQSFN